MVRKWLLIWALLIPGLALGQPREYRVLCLLTEFEDLRFTMENPKDYFEALLGEEGFCLDGGVGSVRDYFRDNSGGIFVPEFTVKGPILLPEKVQTYGKNLYNAGVRIGDTAPGQLLPDVLDVLEDELSEEYDAYYLIYAGYDESQGGPEETLWAHQGISDNDLLYACSAELMGADGERASGIGPICHEIGHLLGLPDFYDTNASAEGSAAGPRMYSLMGTGAHNDEDRRPPYLNALERMLLDWPVQLEPLPEGLLEVKPFPEGIAYYSETDVEGEYFLYECRGGSGWDENLPAGLLIYHVDRSEPLRWEAWREDNTLNARALHPCFYPIRSSAPDLSLQASASLQGGNLVFPGLSRTLCYEPVDWSGNYTGVQLTNIDWNEGQVRLYVLKDNGANLNGMVKDVSGKPLQGVIVTAEGLEGYVVTDAEGFFCLPLPEDLQDPVFSITATMADCRPSQVEMARNSERMASASIVLRKQGDADEASLSKFDRHTSFGFFPQAQVGAVRFSPEELAPYVGRLLSEISFYPYLEPSFEGEVFVTVDIGEKRVLEQKVEGLSTGHYYRNTVDISEAGIVIPEGEYLFVGTGSRKAGQGFYLGTVYPAPAGSSFYQEADGSAWKPLFVQKAGFYMDVALSARAKEIPHPEGLEQLGYLYIADPLGGVYPPGEEFSLQLCGDTGEAQVSWQLDGAEVSGESITLPQEGEHTLQAIIQYSDKHKEILSLKIYIK